MAPTITAKVKTKSATTTQPKNKKLGDDKKPQTTKTAPTETAKRKKDEDESSGKAKKVKVTFAEPVKVAKEEKAKAKEAEQPKEKKKPSKSKVLAPPPTSEDLEESDSGEGNLPKKPQPKAEASSASSKQPLQLISANANAKSKPSGQSQSKPTSSNTKKSKPKKAKSSSPVPFESADDVASGKATEEADDNEEATSEDDHLQGFSTDDEDSSDEDVGDDQESEEKPGLSAFEVSKLPTVAKDDESVKRRLEKAKKQPTEERGVIYIGRLPHGFYEDQLRSYFSQFGDITRLRVSRNKKTGKCKHYGFIEFASSSVAQIVAETMDNYLLTGHILKCKIIPKDEIHPELWIGANKKWRVVPRDRIARLQHNKSRTEGERVKASRRLLKRQNERKRKLEALGIDYDFDAVGYKRTKTGAKA